VLINAGGSAFVDAIHALALAVSIARSAPVRSKYRAVDAAGLVLHRGAAPNGTAFAPSRSGAKKPTDIAATQAQASALTRLGLRAVYANAFLSPGFLKPPATPTAAGSKGNFIASQAQQYRSAAAAHRAYQLFRDREGRLFGSKARSLPTAGLGDEATGLQYVDSKAAGDIYGFGFFWRRGPFVLSLFDVGTADFAKNPAARALAESMDSRAT
jgi:hypothetical protein